MSAIDELKDVGDVIDITSGDIDDGVIIDTTSESGVNKVDLSNLNRKTPKHQIVRQDLSKQRDRSTGNRKTISIDSIAKPEAPDPNAHVSPIDDILGVDNPNSMFSEYIKRKDAEAAEWISEKAEEDAILAEESEDDGTVIDFTGNNIVEDEVEYTSSTNTNITRDDDLDISGLFTDDNDERNTEMNEKETFAPSFDDEIPVINSEEDEIEVEPQIDESLYDDNEEEEDNTEERVVIGEVKEEEKPEVFSADDIAMADDSSDTFTSDIVEDDDTTSTSVASVSEDDVLKHLQKLATEKLKPVSKQLDISSFTVLKKPVTNVNPIFQESVARVVKWVLPSQESVILMKEFSGSELEKLREYSENSRSVDALNRRFRMIYDHIMSPKPATFEQWLKSTPFDDVDHYFFAIYIASFKGANYLPSDCINKDCAETFLTDDINIMDMVKFDTKEDKEKFAELYQSEATPAGKGVYCTEVVPINNKIAIAFRKPSIYNAFEIASLDERTRNNFSSVLDYIPYIDTIYIINEAEQTLTPITYKMFPDNAVRTTRSKIQKYDSIFNTLSVDEFGPVKSYIRAITEKTTGMKYVYPAVECPKCHTLTEEQLVSAEELVFTRYQLGSLVTTKLN